MHIRALDNNAPIYRRCFEDLNYVNEIKDNEEQDVSLPGLFKQKAIFKTQTRAKWQKSQKTRAAP